MQMASKGGGGGGGGGGSDLVKYGAGALGGYGILNMLTNGGGNANPSMNMAALAGGDGDGNDSENAQDMLSEGSGSNEATVGGYNRAQLEDAYVQALMASDPKSADAIGTMIDMLDNTEARNAKTAKDGGNGKAANAARAMQNLMGIYEQGGGAQGPIGMLGQLLNKATFGASNPSQAAYEDMLQSAAVAVARANGEVGVLSNQDIENYRKMLPTFSDNPQQAQIKLQTIMSGLQSME